MVTNMGTADRLIRIVVGLLLVVAPFVSGLALFANPVLYWGAIVVGAVFLVTSLVGFCPLYRVLGISTCAVRAR